MIYNIFVIVLLLIIIIQAWYISRLKNVIEYAATTLKKFGEALLNDGRKVNEEDELKTN